MKIFVELIDWGIWDTIINVPYILKYVMSGTERRKSMEGFEQK